MFNISDTHLSQVKYKSTQLAPTCEEGGRNLCVSTPLALTLSPKPIMICTLPHPPPPPPPDGSTLYLQLSFNLGPVGVVVVGEDQLTAPPNDFFLNQFDFHSPGTDPSTLPPTFLLRLSVMFLRKVSPFISRFLPEH
jgi:hypothetical protein